MRNVHRLRGTFLFATALAALASLPLVARAAADSDAKEISSYKLTEAGLARYTQATNNLGSLAKQIANDCSDDESADDSTSESLDQSVARLDAISGVSPAIQSAGMTTREYVVFGWSLFQAALAAWAAQQPGAKSPDTVLMDNVTFYQAHEATLRKLGEATAPEDCASDE